MDTKKKCGSSAASYDFTVPGQSSVREVDISALQDSRSNHFRRMQGEEWDEFVGSIRDYGILSPLIIRPSADTEGKYEILAGHNRRSGAAEAGLTTVPCISMDVDDVDASVLIGVSNRQREKVTDLEWGWTYRTTLEALRHQGTTSVHTAPGERSIDVVARKYGVNRKTAQRKIRLTYLVPQLYELGISKHYSQKILIDLSYLPPVVQTNVVQAVIIENALLTEDLAAALRSAAGKQDLSINDVLRIFRERESISDPNEKRRPAKYHVPEELFPEGLPKKQRQEYIAAALSYIRDQEIDPLSL